MIYPDFDEIKSKCHGMMRPDVYKKIYETAYYSNAINCVEIGTAHAAATVCIALGFKNSGNSAKIYSFDRFSKNGRRHYEDASQNQNISLTHLKLFGVEGNVELIQGDIAETHKEIDHLKEIGLLMLDSDGQIDRDFSFFYDRLSSDAPLVIDDMADRARITLIDLKRAKIDQKHRLTYLLVNSAVNHNLIEHSETVNQTWFGKRLDRKFNQWDSNAIIKNYRQLVFGSAEIK